MLSKILVLAALLATVAVAAPTDALAGLFRYEKGGGAIHGRIRAECGPQCYTSWYRAGSGNGGTNGCAKYHWLPNATYTVWGHWDRYDGTIKGRVWWLNDYYCGNGVVRNELFVHSEETADNGQACGSPYLEPYCWDGETDYYSLGCIKVRRRPVDADGSTHLGRLDAFHHGVSAVRYVVVTS
jgi:hypothetical protein